MILKAIKKPVDCLAINYDGSDKSLSDVIDIANINKKSGYSLGISSDSVTIISPDNKYFKANLGDYVIKESDGNLYAVTSEVFNRDYEVKE